MRIDQSDSELIKIACDFLKTHYQHNKHHVAAAIKMKGGQIITGIHLKSSVGPSSICAEATAISQAVLIKDDSIATIVAVKYPTDDNSEPFVVSPCGSCRELISDYAPSAHVIIHPNQGSIEKVSISALLPLKFTTYKTLRPST